VVVESVSDMPPSSHYFIFGYFIPKMRLKLESRRCYEHVNAAHGADTVLKVSISTTKPPIRRE
jgi:hypothetical protein